MKTTSYTSQFKKDYKKAQKSNKKIAILKEVTNLLATNQKLPTKYRDHKLIGQYINCWECHLEPDWLLIYSFTKEELILIRVGSHSELFL